MKLNIILFSLLTSLFSQLAFSGLETPAVGSTVNGIGIIRGWVCEANEVTLSIDGDVPRTISYGNGRGDTLAICGDTNNGYELLINWGLLGQGSHEIIIYANGQEVSQSIFTVVTLGMNSTFVRGLSGDYQLTDFPEAGRTTTVSWSEKDQDFVISAVTPVQQWYQPAVSVTWQWQLLGTVNKSYPVELYDIDLFDSSVSLIQELQAAGKKVICYFSAGSWENWRSDAGRFTSNDTGTPLDGWPGEKWLDIRSSNVRAIMQDRLDLAQQKGCDGVEPDNVDGYQNNSGFTFNADDQLDYNRFIAKESHDRQLAVALKNDLDQVAELVGDFDFAVNEQCFEYSECDKLNVFIQNNKPVLNAEYMPELVNDAAARNALCINATQRQFSSLILPLNLDDDFRFSCF